MKWTQTKSIDKTQTRNIMVWEGSRFEKDEDRPFISVTGPVTRGSGKARRQGWILKVNDLSWFMTDVKGPGSLSYAKEKALGFAGKEYREKAVQMAKVASEIEQARERLKNQR